MMIRLTNRRPRFQFVSFNERMKQGRDNDEIVKYYFKPYVLNQPIIQTLKREEKIDETGIGYIVHTVLIKYESLNFITQKRLTVDTFGPSRYKNRNESTQKTDLKN